MYFLEVCLANHLQQELEGTWHISLEPDKVLKEFWLQQERKSFLDCSKIIRNSNKEVY